MIEANLVCLAVRVILFPDLPDPQAILVVTELPVFLDRKAIGVKEDLTDYQDHRAPKEIPAIRVRLEPRVIPVSLALQDCQA